MNAKSPSEKPERLFYFGHGNTVEDWISDVTIGGQQAIEALLAFTDTLIQKGPNNGVDDIDELRHALFNLSAARDAAFRLYERRHELSESLSPEEAIKSVTPSEKGDE